MQNVTLPTPVSPEFTALPADVLPSVLEAEGRKAKFTFLSVTPFLIVHLLGLAAPFLFGISWELVAVCVGSYYLRMFGVTGGYHRYFSHRTYKLGRVPQFLMALLAQSTAQKGALWWAAHHRHHHKHSDLPTDIHSPLHGGFWWSHVGWILDSQTGATDYDAIPDMAKYPELRFLNRWHLLPAIAYGVALLAIGGWAWLFYGMFLSTVFLWHGTFTINSLSHVFGKQRYVSNDTSRNNALLAVVTMGEGWHNNHHTYMTSANQGFFWWEWDPTFYLLVAGEKLGIVRDLRRAPTALLEPKRIRR